MESTPVYFSPTTSKHEGTLCGGIHLHITDETLLQPVALGVKLLDLLRKEKHLTILFICHNLALVQSFCDRILVMKQGKMVEEGTTEEVIWHPKHPYTKLLVDSVL